MSDFLEERIRRLKLRIAKYEDAIDYLIENPTKSYRLNTGQTDEQVMAMDVNELEKTLDRMMNSLANYEQRLGCSATIIGPGW